MGMTMSKQQLIKGKQLIFSMGKDNEILRGLSLEFDDFGDLKTIRERSYHPLNIDMNDGQPSEMNDFLDENFKRRCNTYRCG
ncbi:MAG: hypothetical protein L6V95_14460 [Candidatus Melainabacteria bacterium]|nr:MAG: hypothetical protein L6V95_14460 [Candidatus Melainabacteria bacterium]